MRGLFVLLAALLIASAGTGQGTGKKADPKKVDLVKEALGEKIGGKTLEQWMKEFSLKDSSRREAAIKMVSLFPVESQYKAIPPLLAELKRHSIKSPTD